MDGILRVDKPRGVTSFDMVAQVRRAVGERSVGHAGTLDPMATGLLVVLLGEATKLSPYLTADTKRYVATVSFGATTDSLDADGVVTATMPPGTPPPERGAIELALADRIGPMMQVPPAVSAIKVGGVPMHERTRRGEVVELPARAVTLLSAEVLAVRPGACDLDLTVSKGFYVRSLARDLAEALGTLGHLTALRRVRSGVLTVEGAVAGVTLRAAYAGDVGARADVVGAVDPLASAARVMRSITVDADAVRELGFGRRVPMEVEVEAGTVLVLRDDGVPVCIGMVTEGVLAVQRGLKVG